MAVRVAGLDRRRLVRAQLLQVEILHQVGYCIDPLAAACERCEGGRTAAGRAGDEGALGGGAPREAGEGGALVGVSGGGREVGEHAYGGSEGLGEHRDGCGWSIAV